MPAFLAKIETKHISFTLNVLVSLFFMTVLMFKKGYSYIPMALGGISVIYFLFYLFKFKGKWQLDSDDKWLIFAFLIYFSTFVMSVIVHGDGAREVDNPSKILLFIPLILLFSQFSINQKMLFLAIPIGSAIAGLLAFYQTFWLKLDKPFPEIMSIQAGDIAMTLGTFTLAIAIYFSVRKQYKIAILCFCFALLGMYSSILTLTRGAWISAIVTLPLLLLCYWKNLAKKALIGVVCVAPLLYFSFSTDVIQSRISIIKTEIHHYQNKINLDSSVGHRLEMWKGTLIAAQEKGLLGFGTKGYSEFKRKLASEGRLNENVLQYTSEHNQYLDTLAKKGIVGLTGLMSIFFVPLLYFYRKYKENEANKPIAVLGFIHISTIMIYCLTQGFLSHNSGSIFYFFTLIVLYSALKAKEKHNA